MIETVEAAIMREIHNQPSQPRYRSAAIAVLTSMRNPTEEMFGGQYGVEARKLFTEMIDAALST